MEKNNQKFILLNGDEITILEINDLIKNEVLMVAVEILENMPW